MERWFEIWETETGNLAGDYESQAEALAVIRRILESDHPETVKTLLLTEEHESGKSIQIGAGEELVRLAVQASVTVSSR
jgi:hypothetical protein